MALEAPNLNLHGTPADPAGATHPHRPVLDRLIQMGDDFARALHAQAIPQPPTPAPQPPAPNTPPPPKPDASTLIPLAAAFAQIARAVRRCIMLARVLDAPSPPAPDPARHRAAARKQIIRQVEDRIGHVRDGATADALQNELRERLDAPDLDDDIATRPAANIIKEICRDLGLSSTPGDTPWKRRTPDDIRQLGARAAAPSRAHQPSPAPPSPTPRNPAHDAAQPAPGLQADRDAAPLAPPNPIHPGGTLPEDLASIVARLMRPPAPTDARWRPPPLGS